jgi:hypothetical protein
VLFCAVLLCAVLCCGGVAWRVARPPTTEAHVRSQGGGDAWGGVEAAAHSALMLLGKARAQLSGLQGAADARARLLSHVAAQQRTHTPLTPLQVSYLHCFLPIPPRRV